MRVYRDYLNEWTIHTIHRILYKVSCIKIKFSCKIEQYMISKKKFVTNFQACLSSVIELYLYDAVNLNISSPTLSKYITNIRKKKPKGITSIDTMYL